MSTRKTYTKEFKLDAVSLVLEQDYSKAEASRSLSINPNMLARWIKELDTEYGHAFRGNGKLSPEQEPIKELQRRVKRLEMETDILKK
jgi:transposase